MDWLSAASSVLGAAAGSPDNAGPAMARADNVFNSSGWTVNQRGGLAGINPWLAGAAVLGAVLVALVWLKGR